MKSVFITYTHEAHVKHKSCDVNVTHSYNECIVILGPIHNLFIENVSIVAIKTSQYNKLWLPSNNGLTMTTKCSLLSN